MDLRQYIMGQHYTFCAIPNDIEIIDICTRNNVLIVYSEIPFVIMSTDNIALSTFNKVNLKSNIINIEEQLYIGDVYTSTTRKTIGSNDVFIVIGLSKIKKIKKTGSGRIELSYDKHIENLSINITGSGRLISDPIQVTNTLNCTINGSGHISLRKSISSISKLSIIGSGSIVHGISKNISSNIIGSGKITTKGESSNHITGSGTVTNEYGDF